MSGPRKRIAGRAPGDGVESRLQAHAHPTATTSPSQAGWHVVNSRKAVVWGIYVDGADAGRIAEQLRKVGLDATVNG